MQLTKRLNGKDYMVVAWTEHEVMLKQLNPPHEVISQSRKKVYGFKKKGGKYD